MQVVGLTKLNRRLLSFLALNTNNPSRGGGGGCKGKQVGMQGVAGGKSICQNYGTPPHKSGINVKQLACNEGREANAVYVERDVVRILFNRRFVSCCFVLFGDYFIFIKNKKAVQDAKHLLMKPVSNHSAL